MPCIYINQQILWFLDGIFEPSYNRCHKDCLTGSGSFALPEVALRCASYRSNFRSSVFILSIKKYSRPVRKSAATVRQYYLKLYLSNVSDVLVS